MVACGGWRARDLGCSATVATARLGCAVLMPLALSGCSGGEPAGMDGAGAAADAGPTVVFSGTVAAIQVGSEGDLVLTPLAEVEVCLHGQPEIPCTKSDLSGSFALAGVPANFEGAVTFVREGYWNLLLPGQTKAVDLTGNVVPMYSHVLAGFFGAMIGITYTQGVTTGITLGADRLVAADAGTESGEVLQKVAGVKFAIAPASGTGAVYLDDKNTPDPELTETSAAGVAVFGDVAPGIVEVTATPPTADGGAPIECARLGDYAWPSTKPSALRTPVVEGFVTYGAAFLCSP